MIDFKLPYSRQNVLSFLSHFLPDDFERTIEENIKLNFKPQYLEQIHKLGECQSLQSLHVFEVVHGSENDPRVSLSRDAFRLLANFGVRKALVFFVSRKSLNYRLSLVTLDLKLEGKKVEQEYSNPRRYSFFLGHEAKIHTPEEFLVKKGMVKDTQDLIARFDVEIVTKEFFARYKMLFDGLQKFLSKDYAFKNFAGKNSIDIDSFAKKILGQIVFCYFLQKKGWLGAPKDEDINKGNKDFMRSLFQRSVNEGKNFYNGYLEYLFYDVLNSAPDEKGNFYRKYLGCQVPFLNGGLFEPLENYDWKKSFIHIPDTIFSNKQGMGILDVFDLYNFTVYEDDPIDREVSVDPEMLGKVFENLLPENIRRGQGAYYTPREIVHYMSQESLINYLIIETGIGEKNIRKFITSKDHLFTSEGVFAFSPTETEKMDEALANIKICDPACGSGAFLVGLLHEIVIARRILNPKKNEHVLKKEAIQNSIYGVDIDPGAVEIAKLRLWLSLVVDYALAEIEPLPNLDYKIMCGNSLLEEFEGVKFYDGVSDELSLFKDERKEKIEELKKITKEYFNISDEKMKRTKREEVNKLKDWFIKATLEKHRKVITAQRRKIEARANMFEEKSREEYFTKQNEIFFSEAKIIEVLRNLHNPQKARPFFIWKLEFMDVFEDKGGFDVVIANPPYIKEYVHRDAFDGLRDSPYYQGKMDIWYLFACKGIDWLKDQGTLSFIAQNNWVTSYGSSKMRNKVIEDTKILQLIDFGDFKIFETAGIQTMIMMFEKAKSMTTYSFDYRRLGGNGLVFDDVLAVLSKKGNPKAEYLNPIINRMDLKNKKLTFSNSNAELLLTKILARSNFKFDPIQEVAQGIVCPQDYVNKASQEELGDSFRVGDGIFTISNDELKKMGLSKKELALIKPFYTTNELQKWYGNPINCRWIIYTDSSFKNRKRIEEYPGIKKHFDKFNKVITSDNKPYGLHRARDEYFFKGEKVVTVRKCVEPSFTYIDFDSYVSATFYVIKTERISPKYLVGLLNSKLISFWLKHKGKMQGNNYQIDKEPIIDLPILAAPPEDQKKIVIVTDKILAAKKRKPEANTVSLENEIDQIVFDLYGLTKEEIEIVEKFKQ